MSADDTLVCDKVLPLAEWVQKDEEDGCKPCFLAALVPWYMDVLKESGREDLAEMIEGAVKGEEVEPLQVARVLDRIKGEVKEDIRERLVRLDCMAQTVEYGGGEA